MKSQNARASFEKLKGQARKILMKRMQEALRLETSRSPRKNKSSLNRDNMRLVFDPISIRIENTSGGVFEGTYDIRQTLVALSKTFHERKMFDEDEIAAYARTVGISFDQAMLRVATRHVEADIFSTIKAARFLHEQLQPAITQLLNQLLDEAFLKGLGEYGLELVEPTKTFEKIGRAYTRNAKQRSGLVRRVGRPESWTKEELMARVRSAISRQKDAPTLARIAEAMNLGGLSGGASTLGKLLTRHSIDWKTLKKEWKPSKKRT